MKKDTATEKTAYGDKAQEVPVNFDYYWVRHVNGTTPYMARWSAGSWMFCGNASPQSGTAYVAIERITPLPVTPPSYVLTAEMIHCALAADMSTGSAFGSPSWPEGRTCNVDETDVGGVSVTTVTTRGWTPSFSFREWVARERGAMKVILVTETAL